MFMLSLLSKISKSLKRKSVSYTSIKLKKEKGKHQKFKN